jgi:hypothetical protein
MAACDNVCAKLVSDMTYDCNNKSTGGIYQTIKLVNMCDILDNLADFTVNTATSGSTCAHSITAYTGTASELNAVTANALPNKQLMTAGFSSSNTDYGTYFTHSIQLFSQGMTEKSVCNIKALGNGAEVVAFVHQKNMGVDNKEAYWVYGFKNGLKLGEVTFSTAENNGNILIPLTSTEPDLETQPPLRLLLTDYATTKVFFDSL